MISKYIEQVDRRSGEVLQGCVMWVPERPKLKEGWVMTFQDSLEAIAKDPDLTGEHFRVFMYLCSKLSFENWIHQSQKEIAEALGLKKQNVSRAVRLLTEKKIVLVEIKNTSSARCYRLNPTYGWRGKVKNLLDYQREQTHLHIVPSGKDIPTPTEPASTEPAQTDPASTEPAQTEPASTESAA